MKVYISAGFTARERLRPIRDRLWKLGHVVVSSWIDETEQPKDIDKRDFYKKLALKDLAEVVSADLLISDHLEPSTSGGRDIEFGVALGRFQHCQVWIVGEPPRLNPFHELADMRFASWSECLGFLGDSEPIGSSQRSPGCICGRPGCVLMPESTWGRGQD